MTEIGRPAMAAWQVAALDALQAFADASNGGIDVHVAQSKWPGKPGVCGAILRRGAASVHLPLDSIQLLDFDLARGLQRLEARYRVRRAKRSILSRGDALMNSIRACSDAVQRHASSDRKDATTLPDAKENGCVYRGSLWRHRGEIQQACAQAGVELAASASQLTAEGDAFVSMLEHAKTFDVHRTKLLQRLRSEDGVVADAHGGSPHWDMECAAQHLAFQQRATTVGLSRARDSLSRPRVGVLCGHAELCPFAAPTIKRSDEWRATAAASSMLKQILDVGAEMSASIDQTNTKIRLGLSRILGVTFVRVVDDARAGSDIGALLVYAPRMSISEKSAHIVDQFLLSGRPVIVLVQRFDVAIKNMPLSQDLCHFRCDEHVREVDGNIVELLAGYGLSVGGKLVADPVSNRGLWHYSLRGNGGKWTAGWAEDGHPLLPSVRAALSAHPATRSLRRNNSTAWPFAVSIKASATGLRTKATTLVESMPTASTMRGLETPDQSAVRDALHGAAGTGPHPLAVLIEGEFDTRFPDESTAKRHP